MGKAGKEKLSLWATFLVGFKAIKLLDNTNVYGVIYSECIANVVMSSMWMKVLTPYTLFLANGDKTVVGNAMTLNGITRAVAGVAGGRALINNLGADGSFAMAGVLGLIGMTTNGFCLTQGSMTAVYALNFVWALFNGLWNSCLETTWARSVLREKREDVNGARQVLNKLTTACGPLVSICIFAWLGNKWTLPLMTTVILFGTAFTAIPVLLCFCFNRIHEIWQECDLCDIRAIEFQNRTLTCDSLVKFDFDPKAPGAHTGPVKLTYPLSSKSKYGKLRVLTPDLKDTNFILGKQQRACFRGVSPSELLCVLHFTDPTRASVRATLESVLIYMDTNRCVDTSFSSLTFQLTPRLEKMETPEGPAILIGAKKLLRSKSASSTMTNAELTASLLPAPAQDRGKSKHNVKQYSPNLRMANCIVLCDILNAVGSGMSLKFMDLFLIEEYEVSPIALLVIAFATNLLTVYLTPVVKKLMTHARHIGFKGALGVTIIWGMSIIFLGLICVPGMPIWVVVPSIGLMQSLSSCTKAYNRAKLVNALPRNRVANYMVWDSLNKANQGGIAIFGAQLVHYGGYRGCFVCTLIVMLIRWSLWTGYLMMRGLKKKSAIPSASEGGGQAAGEDEADEAAAGPASEFERSSTLRFQNFGEVDSELFPGADPSEDDAAQRRTNSERVGNLLIVEEETQSESEESSSAYQGDGDSPRGGYSGGGPPVRSFQSVSSSGSAEGQQPPAKRRPSSGNLRTLRSTPPSVTFAKTDSFVPQR
eukprot:TRINITY_DN24471_c0_g2_i1.p1 TRINITY_DN24471_c0_g2~~TRINITY_DN24471_c0_g2_i1.p1  ORF type:complete len:761 (+),score=151.82 TRINITY_DN24471_c0_g2_i1:102-2384(+)